MKYLDILERQAGHIVVSIVLMAVGAILWKLNVPKAEDVLPFAMGVLARSMTLKGEMSNGNDTDSHA